jgi:hypothetical protein
MYYFPYYRPRERGSVPPGSEDGWELEDSNFLWELEDGSGYWLLES